MHQKEIRARQNFDVGIFSLKPNGLCPLVETLVLQEHTERMPDFLDFQDLSKPNATLKLALLCAEEVTNYLLGSLPTSTILPFYDFVVY